LHWGPAAASGISGIPGLSGYSAYSGLRGIEGSIGVGFYSYGTLLAGTVTNAGTIIGTDGTAVQFGGGDDRMVVDPGAVFIGTVDGGGGSDVLELAAGTGDRTLSGLGTSFANFETVVFDANANWTVTVDNTAAFTGMISGFAAGDILDLTGKAATGATYAGGVLTVQNGGTIVAAFNLAGSYTSADFSLGSDGHGGTAIGIAAGITRRHAAGSNADQCQHHREPGAEFRGLHAVHRQRPGRRCDHPIPFLGRRGWRRTLCRQRRDAADQPGHLRLGIATGQDHLPERLMG